MSTDVLSAPRAPGPSRDGRGRRWIVLCSGSLLAALIGFVLGTHRSPQVSEMTGRVSVGDHMGSIQVGSWFYGLSDSVPWFDSSGSFHESGWPQCLQQIHSSGGQGTVRFGATSVTFPDGGRHTPALYVDCRP